jgi:hypothetical protein
MVLHDNMADLVKAEIPFLPLHDALLVPEAAKPRLVEVMQTNLAILRVSLRLQAQALKNPESMPPEFVQRYCDEIRTNDAKKRELHTPKF